MQTARYAAGINRKSAPKLTEMKIPLRTQRQEEQAMYRQRQKAQQDSLGAWGAIVGKVRHVFGK